MNSNIFSTSTFVEEVEEKTQEQLQAEIEEMAACDCEAIPELYY